MSELTLPQWARNYRAAAKKDKMVALQDHLRELGLKVKPQLLLDGTIQVVQACSAYMSIDRQSYAPFLAMQTYDPARSSGAIYAFTFSLYDKAFARVLLAGDLGGLDLADLYGHPWQKYKICGYDHFLITRVDRKAITKREEAKLERQVTSDLRFDYSGDELDFWFDDSQIPGALLVMVQDREE
jgi:hypothetical protein